MRTALPRSVLLLLLVSLRARRGGGDRSVLDIRTGDGRQLEWDWELPTDRVTMWAIGTRSAAGDTVSLLGRPTGFLQGGSLQTVSFSLTREGPVLRGTFTNANNPVPGRGVQAGPPLTRSIC